MFRRIFTSCFRRQVYEPKGGYFVWVNASMGSAQHLGTFEATKIWTYLSWVSWVVLVEFRTWRLWEICFQLLQSQLRCQFLQRMELNQSDWVSTRTVSNYSDRLHVDFSVKSQLVLKWIDVSWCLVCPSWAARSSPRGRWQVAAGRPNWEFWHQWIWKCLNHRWSKND